MLDMALDVGSGVEWSGRCGYWYYVVYILVGRDVCKFYLGSDVIRVIKVVNFNCGGKWGELLFLF